MRNILSSLFFFIIYVNSYASEISFITEDVPPYSYKDNYLEVSGIFPDILRKTLKILKQDANIQMLPWSSGYALSQIPNKIAIFPLVRTKDRENIFHWAGPIATSSIALISIKNYKISNSTLNDYSYGVIRGDIGAISLGILGVESNKILDFDGFEEMIDALFKGKVHMISYDFNVAKSLAKRYELSADKLKKIATLTRNKAYYAFNKSVSRKFVKNFQKALDQVKKDKEFMDSLEEKYL